MEHTALAKDLLRPATRLRNIGLEQWGLNCGGEQGEHHLRHWHMVERKSKGHPSGSMQ